MTAFTNVSDTVLEPGDPIRSVDIIAIKDNTNFLNEKHTTNVQTFNASGTWSKPTNNGTPVGTMARIQVWGGGGGGARNASTSTAGGGGGGGYNEVTVPLSSLDSTVTVTVGAGGAGRTGTTGAGTAGGTSSFGSFCIAYGGGAQPLSLNSPGGGGGQLSAGTQINFDGSILAQRGSPDIYTLWAGGNAGNLQNGENGVFGGAGGGSAPGNTNTTGGVSVYGGAGGNGGRATSGIDGQQPGGGGGGRNNALNGGNGAAGRVVVTVF